MTLLAPWAAAIAGAVGGAALLMFYLLKLRRRPVRVSSILYWQPMARDQEANVPLRMLRPTLLFFLQLLILALLAIALGRPAIGGGFGGASGVVVIVDQSASMAAPGGARAREGETALDEAKRAARDIIDDVMRSGASAMVVALGAEARPLTPMTTDAAALRRAIDAINQTDQPARLAEAERLLSAMTDAGASEEEEAPSLAAAFITDGQRAPGERPLIAPGAIVREQRVGQAEPAPNAGIIGIAARRDYQDPAQVRVFARFAASLARPERVVASVLLDGETLDRRAVTIDPLEGAATTFELRRTGAATVAVTIEADDAIAADNGAAVRLRPAPGARALLVVPEGEVVDDARRSPVWLIAEVLQAMDLRGVDMVRATRYEQLARDGQLGAWDVVVFDRVAPGAAPPIPSLSFGAAIPGAGWEVDAEAPPSRVLSWQRAHPVLRDISLDTVQVGAGALRPAARPGEGQEEEAAREAGEASAPGEQLALGRAGPLIVLVEQAGVRRILVGFEPAASSWPRQVGFPVFVADALDFITLRGEAEAGRAFTTAEPVRLRLAGEVGAGAARARAAPVLEGPAQVTGRIVPDGEGGGLIADFGLVELAGVYRLADPAPGDESMAAVNLADEAETRLTRAPPQDEFRRPEAGETGGADDSAGAREIWHWFALAALGLSLVEWVVSVWGSRR